MLCDWVSGRCMGLVSVGCTYREASVMGGRLPIFIIALVLCFIGAPLIGLLIIAVLLLTGD